MARTVERKLQGSKRGSPEPRTLNPEPSFRPGIETLLTSHRDWIAGQRVGLLSHPAAVGVLGFSSAQLLAQDKHVRLRALFGPEHGYFGGALAGQSVGSRKHPDWQIPVFSLYGRHRKPTPRMLREVDTIVFDLQDIAARPYTFVSTLRLLLEAAAEEGKRVIVADRPVPLPSCVDGPVMHPPFESFVAALPIPMFHGMTPGEAALWMKRALQLDVDLKVAPMRGYRRQPRRQPGWPPWIPPSPGIVSWETAECYSAMVFLEAFPGLDHGRGLGLPFQVFGAPGLDGVALCRALNASHFPGAVWHPHVAPLPDAAGRPRLATAVRLVVTDPGVFLPIAASVHMLHALQEVRGAARWWCQPRVRPDFFDKLYGTDRIRIALQGGASPRDIARSWQDDVRAFEPTRNAVLLYPSV